MKTARTFIVAAMMTLASVLPAQERVVAIQAGKLFDGKSDALQTDVTILIKGNRIAEVGKNVKIPAGAQTIDLRTSTVLPGLIDAHTHVLLQGDITPAEYEDPKNITSLLAL
jgi:imidazolonepropionase-like amidohydrolase